MRLKLHCFAHLILNLKIYTHFFFNDYEGIFLCPHVFFNDNALFYPGSAHSKIFLQKSFFVFLKEMTSHFCIYSAHFFLAQLTT